MTIYNFSYKYEIAWTFLYIPENISTKVNSSFEGIQPRLIIQKEKSSNGIMLEAIEMFQSTCVIIIYALWTSNKYTNAINIIFFSS